MDLGSAYLDLLGFVGLAVTAAVVACSILVYTGLAAERRDAEQRAYDRRFAAIVAHFDD